MHEGDEGKGDNDNDGDDDFDDDADAAGAGAGADGLSVSAGGRGRERGGSGGSRGGSGGGSGGRSRADTRRGVEVPPSGSEIRAFVNLFEDVAVNPPQDAVLRQHWDTWVKEDVGKHNTQLNRQVRLVGVVRVVVVV